MTRIYWATHRYYIRSLWDEIPFVFVIGHYPMIYAKGHIGPPPESLHHNRPNVHKIVEVIIARQSGESNVSIQLSLGLALHIGILRDGQQKEIRCRSRLLCSMSYAIASGESQRPTVSVASTSQVHDSEHQTQELR